MWVWFFILLVILLMIMIQFISARRNEPFRGFRSLMPEVNEETAEELIPHKNKTQIFIENLTGTPMPHFETTLHLYQKDHHSKQLIAEWSIGDNLKNYFTQKYGKEFWQNSQEVLRVFSSNTFPEPYYRDTYIEFDQGKQEIEINAPGGETVNAEIGVITQTGSFIPFAKSNDVIIPQKAINSEK
ncbi:MAG: DUF4912 domain-containing protein [Peptococcales bacterium]|jgi:hypothetical protein